MMMTMAMRWHSWRLSARPIASSSVRFQYVVIVLIHDYVVLVDPVNKSSIVNCQSSISSLFYFCFRKDGPHLEDRNHRQETNEEKQQGEEETNCSDEHCPIP